MSFIWALLLLIPLAAAGMYFFLYSILIGLYYYNLLLLVQHVQLGFYSSQDLFPRKLASRNAESVSLTLLFSKHVLNVVILKYVTAMSVRFFVSILEC